MILLKLLWVYLRSNNVMDEKTYNNENNLSIPLFPLTIFVLPGETKLLHIFEPRYKNLIADTDNYNGMFGIPFYKRSDSYDLGTLVKVDRILKRYPEGESDISIKGIGIFTVTSFNPVHPERLYPYGEVNIKSKNDIEPGDKLTKEFIEFSRIILNKTPYPQVSSSLYKMSIYLGLQDWEKYQLFREDNTNVIIQKMRDLLKLKTLLARQKDSVNELYSLN